MWFPRAALVLPAGLVLLLVADLASPRAGGAQIRPPGGTTPGGDIFDRLREDTTRPAAPVPPPAARPAPDMIWVPDRYVSVPGVQGQVLVPGHWERRLSEHEVHVPPLTGHTPGGGTVQWPAGTYRPPHERQSP